MSSIYITESGAYLRKRGGRMLVGRNNEILFEVPLEIIEDITLVDSVHISSKMITECLEREIPLSWLSSQGSFYGCLINNNSVDVLKHRKQFMLLEEGTLYFTLAKKVVFAKCHNQLTILRRYNRNAQSQAVDMAINNIIAVRKNIFSADKLAPLLGYEGIISRIYFAALGEIVPEGFRFDGRSKRPPKDPFNSMLSLGYSMLFNEIMSDLLAIGLHPFVGFMHRPAKGHPALVSDLIEEWRAPLIDSLVMSVIKRGMVTLDMFDNTEEGCFLNAMARKQFLQAYNRKLKSENKYLDTKESYRESLKRQCRKYASAIANENPDLYVPLELR